ncbi:cysteine-rich CWC family protein [Paenibacillus tepidiphilus]|uniref:cysteine-rich CWC family protein n=1 Tax=Paenibacillus tepidiphilus TaxID=2608683 RepID=UPI00123C1226
MPSDKRNPAAERTGANCPVCGKDNGCALAHGNPADTCWCMSFSVPRETLEQIKQLYPEASCICRDCLQALAGDISSGSQG